MIGAPGETPETIAESLTLLDNYAIPLRTWVTIGICLWTHRQQILEQRDMTPLKTVMLGQIARHEND